VREVAKAIPAELRETAFKVAMGLLLVDEEESEHEFEVVGILTTALSIGERAIGLAKEAREAMKRD
jgi:hypothetical protein